MKHILNLILLFSISSGSIYSQEDLPDLYPNVQNIKQKGDPLKFKGFNVEDSKWHSIIQNTPIDDMIANSSDEGVNLEIEINKHIKATQDENNLAKAEGAYDLIVGKETVELKAQDSTGIFYGLQTLGQLVDADQIAQVEISDFPTVKYRGVIEGFYGTPWSQKDRMRQLEFYGKVKANTYIYGPKDDPYHSSPDWRKPYPEDQAKDIKNLVKKADENFVHFTWAIHPGQDIKWNKEDRNNVLEKFEKMYDLGVRSFALFFDDISGEGTDAHKQAELLNFLNEKFVKAKDDVRPLMLTPTEYNKSWANPDADGYLNVLGDELDPSIEIMWTGDLVVADVTKSTLEWVNKRIKRPALIWWNFPVSDYIRDHLLLGPSYGLEANIDADEMAGILSNPMEHAEASKPGIFGASDYSWNTRDYRSQKSWEKSIEVLYPNSFLDYKVFAENNSDPGKNWHGYRRKESVDIAPYIQRLKDSIKNERPNTADLKYIEGYYAEVSQAAKNLRKTKDNPALNKEVKPWLDHFTLLGKQGVAQLQNYRAQENDPEELWQQMVDHHKHTAKMEQQLSMPEDDDVIPVTGSLVLQPFVDLLQTHNNQNLIARITGQDDFTSDNPGIGSLDTDIEAISDVELSAGAEGQILIKPILEVFTIKPKASFKIELSEPLQKAEITSQFESDFTDWMEIEVSKDDQNWTKADTREEDKKVTAQVDQEFKYVRATNNSADTISLRLNKFELQNKAEGSDQNNIYVQDLNVFTSSPLKTGESIKAKSHKEKPDEAVVLTDSKDAVLTIEAQNSRGKWKNVSGDFSGTYIEVKLPKNTKAIRVTTDQDIRIYEVLWR